MSEQKIVVGVDDSEPSRHALAWALNEGQVRSAEVVVVHQYHYPWAPAPAGFYPEALAEAELGDDARSVAERIVDEVMHHGGWTDRPKVSPRFGPNAARLLCDEAGDADLLVVGQRGGGGFLGLRLGSVSEGCLHASPTTMVVVPEGSAQFEPIKRITVGVDASDRSGAAIAWAVEEGERLGIPVVALMAWSWLGPPLREMQPVVGWDEEKAAALLDEVLTTAGAAHLEREVVHSKPAKALVDRSAAGDLVVVAAFGTSAAVGALAGSTSRQLAHHAHAPIAIVR